MFDEMKKTHRLKKKIREINKAIECCRKTHPFIQFDLSGEEDIKDDIVYYYKEKGYDLYEEDIQGEKIYYIQFTIGRFGRRTDLDYKENCKRL